MISLSFWCKAFAPFRTFCITRCFESETIRAFWLKLFNCIWTEHFHDIISFFFSSVRCWCLALDSFYGVYRQCLQYLQCVHSIISSACSFVARQWVCASVICQPNHLSSLIFFSQLSSLLFPSITSLMSASLCSFLLHFHAISLFIVTLLYCFISSFICPTSVPTIVWKR